MFVSRNLNGHVFGSNNLGFTLLELLVAMIITTVVASMAIMWAKDWVNTTHANANVRSFASIVHLARYTAIVTNKSVILCPMRTDRCLGRDQWHEGAAAFVDTNKNRMIDNDESPLARVPAASEGQRIYWRSFRNRSYLRFKPTGLTDWQNGHFLFCDEQNAATNARQLTLNYAGRLYFSRDSDNNGVHEDAHGEPLEC